jgi:transposase
MATQLALRFDEVPLTCEVQARYHAIAGCLAGKKTPAKLAAELSLGYSTVTRWLRDFRQQGMAGLFPAPLYSREPYTPERVIVHLLFFKCCVPKVGDRELARVLYSTTGHLLHNQTVKSLCERYFFWRYEEFQKQIRYPVPDDPAALRLEIVRLEQQGWTEVRIAQLLNLNRRTVRKWLRRAREQNQSLSQPDSGEQLWLLDLPRAPYRVTRKVYLSTIHVVLELQKKYGYAGWFRIKGYLERDHKIYLSSETIKKIMALNRRLHLAPVRPVKIEEVRDCREGPPKSQRPFEHTYIDLRYLDAKPEGIQLYSCLLLEGFSRTILAGSLTSQQDVGVVLHVYYQALLSWGLWEQIISDHGGQFRSAAFGRVNRRLQIKHDMYEKGHPWQNLIESQFGIQARLGEYGWERCKSVEAAQEFHRELIRDHNRLPHFAHRHRNDLKQAPLEVLGGAKGRAVEAADLHQAFSRQYWQRKTDGRGFVRIGRWKIYIEEALAKTVVQVRYWEGKLRAEYERHLLTEYDCQWDKRRLQPKAINNLRQYPHPFECNQGVLFDPLWVRDPLELGAPGQEQEKKAGRKGEQLRLYLGPELVKVSGR